jgi:hypothetical protein
VVYRHVVALPVQRVNFGGAVRLTKSLSHIIYNSLG